MYEQQFIYYPKGQKLSNRLCGQGSNLVESARAHNIGEVSKARPQSATPGDDRRDYQGPKAILPAVGSRPSFLWN